MTKIISSKNKFCKTTNSNIFGSKKFKPAQLSKIKKRVTEYCKKIRETKKIRLFYGNLKLKYIKTVIQKISKYKGNKIDHLVQFLERRLSTIVFRAKFATSIFAAKQLISHGFILVNGNKVDISSYLVKPNDVISLKESVRENIHILTALSSNNRNIPEFLDCSKKFEIIFLKLPVVNEELFPCEMNLQKVIEFLS